MIPLKPGEKRPPLNMPPVRSHSPKHPKKRKSNDNKENHHKMAPEPPKPMQIPTGLANSRIQPQPQSDRESGKSTSLSKLNESGFDEEGYPLRRVAIRRTDMDLYKLDPRRPCEFKLNKKGEPVVRPINAPYQITAAFAYTLGDVVYPPCVQCSRNNGPWQQCVVYTPRLGDGSLGTPFWKGGCSNCHYSNKASACSLRAKPVEEESAAGQNTATPATSPGHGQSNAAQNYHAPTTAPPPASAPGSGQPGTPIRSPNQHYLLAQSATQQQTPRASTQSTQSIFHPISTPTGPVLSTDWDRSQRTTHSHPPVSQSVELSPIRNASIIKPEHEPDENAHSLLPAVQPEPEPNDQDAQTPQLTFRNTELEVSISQKGFSDPEYLRNVIGDFLYFAEQLSNRLQVLDTEAQRAREKHAMAEGENDAGSGEQNMDIET